MQDVFFIYLFVLSWTAEQSGGGLLVQIKKVAQRYNQLLRLQQQDRFFISEDCLHLLFHAHKLLHTSIRVLH